jgi:hypothetical protein
MGCEGEDEDAHFRSPWGVLEKYAPIYIGTLFHCIEK